VKLEEQMQFQFVYSEIINGAVIGAPLEGKATIEPDHGSGDWCITGLVVDGFIPRSDGTMGVDWCDVDLPEHHELFKKILLDLYRPAMRFEIDLAWNQHVSDCRANREAA
jgi:hypothetical protein